MKSTYLLITLLFIGINRSSAQSKIEDSDGDTHIETNHGIPAFDDQIHFTLNGNLKWKMVGDRLETGNPSSNVIIGFSAGEVNTGTVNTFVGNYSGYNNVSGHNNIGLGVSSLENNVNGSFNTALGVSTLQNYQSAGNSGSYSTAIGNRAGRSLVSGFANTFLGANAMQNVTAGDYNCIIGMGAGQNKTTGGRNILIGYGANAEGASGSNNIIIGFQAGRFETGSNKLYIENSSSSDPLLYGEFDHDELTINGFTTVNRLDGAEEVARFVSQSEPQITLYRGSTYAGHLQHYKQDLVISNRIHRGSVRIEANNGNIQTVGEFFNDGDFKAYGDRLYFGTAERFRDAGGNLIESNSTFIPNTCGTRDLGRSTNRWDQLYIDNAVLVANCFSSGGGSGTGVSADGQGDEYGLAEIMDLKSVQGFKNNSNEITVTQLQEVMPALVEEYDEIIDEQTEEITLVPSANPSIRITDFIPVLIKSIQDQQTIIKDQETRISELEDRLNTVIDILEKRENNTSSGLLQELSFELNPNPADGFIEISFTIEKSFNTAQVKISNMQGVQVAQQEILSMNGRVNMDTSVFPEGTFISTLFVDGIIQGSHKFIIAH